MTQTLSLREREGPAAKRWEGERFHRPQENPSSFRCAIALNRRALAAMDAIANARRLRQGQTLAEKTLWKLVRNRRLGGFRFLRQHPIDRYIADFICEAGKLIVELDGAAHDRREDYDERRTQVLELFGYLVLRFPNDRVLADPGGVTDEILAVLRSARL